MKNNKPSLKKHFRDLSLRWMGVGFAFSIGLSAALFSWLPLKESENKIRQISENTVAARRIDILSGDVRGLELQLARDLKLGQGEQAIMLDTKKQPWLKDPYGKAIANCSNPDGICSEFFSRRVISYYPIFFDSKKTQLVGYLYINMAPSINWTLVSFVIFSITLGMLIQGIGSYVSLTNEVNKVSDILKGWASGISLQPKNREQYQTTPFEEILPIEAALYKLSSEIESLTDLARREGALSTLRSVGHDILNPVSRIKRLLGILKLEKHSIDPEILENLQSNTKRLSIYADQLKLMYKSQIEKIGSQENITNVRSEINNLAKEIKNDLLIQGKSININIKSEENLLAAIPPAVFARMLENLLTNSLQAVPINGVIKIDARRDSDIVSISVSDNGSGIPESMSEKIFEAGFTTRSNQGTGLGLFVVKQSCDQYGGKISLSSDSSFGTIFKISLPSME